MSKEIGPREKALREMREQRFNRKPSATDLRKKIAAVKPMAKKHGGRRGR